MLPAKQMPNLYVFFGLIASGKSTLAERFASRFGFAYFNTDRVRKDLAGINQTSRQADQFNQGIYSSGFTRKTYQAILNLTEAEIKSGGRGVVLDGSYSSKDERARVIKLAAASNSPCVFILCVCSEKTVRERLEQRASDPAAVSDGRWEIYQVQKEKFQYPTELESSQLITMETKESVDVLVENLASTLNLR